MLSQRIPRNPARPRILITTNVALSSMKTSPTLRNESPATQRGALQALPAPGTVSAPVNFLAARTSAHPIYGACKIAHNANLLVVPLSLASAGVSRLAHKGMPDTVTREKHWQRYHVLYHAPFVPTFENLYFLHSAPEKQIFLLQEIFLSRFLFFFFFTLYILIRAYHLPAAD